MRTVTLYRVEAVDLVHPDTVPRWLGLSADPERAEHFAGLERAAMDPARWLIRVSPIRRQVFTGGGS